MIVGAYLYIGYFRSFILLSTPTPRAPAGAHSCCGVTVAIRARISENPTNCWISPDALCF